jgi:hypothetical protein
VRADNLQIAPVTQAAEGYFHSRRGVFWSGRHANRSEFAFSNQGWHGTEAARDGMEEAVLHAITTIEK